MTTKPSGAVARAYHLATVERMEQEIASLRAALAAEREAHHKALDDYVNLIRERDAEREAHEKTKRESGIVGRGLDALLAREKEWIAELRALRAVRERILASDEYAPTECHSEPEERVQYAWWVCSSCGEQHESDREKIEHRADCLWRMALAAAKAGG